MGAAVTFRLDMDCRGQVSFAVLLRTIGMAGILLCLAGFPLSARADTGTPLRIVSLAPNLTELVYVLGFGSNLVGRSSACNYPPESQAVPVVGGFGRPNWEVLESLHPDLVLATDLEKPGLLQRVNERGMRGLLMPCESWDELLQAAITLSEAMGRRSAGEQFVKEMTARRNALAARVASFSGTGQRPRVYVEVWGDPLTTAGANTFLTDIVQLAGGTNIAGSLRPKYVSVNSEWVIGQDPDVILLAYMLPKTSAAAALAKRPAWDKIRAIRQNAICDSIPPDLLLRPGPRVIQGAEAFAAWLERGGQMSDRNQDPGAQN